MRTQHWQCIAPFVAMDLEMQIDAALHRLPPSTIVAILSRIETYCATERAKCEADLARDGDTRPKRETPHTGV